MDEELTPVELGERIAGASRMLGIWVGYGEVISLLRKWAGEEFAKGNDKKAHCYRDLANDLELLRPARRKLYDDEYRPKEEEAFKKLEMAVFGD